MKYVVFIGDGMSDEPLAELGGKTPLMVALTPNLDRMVREGIGGWCQITPDGYSPGSDVANLGVLGYDVTNCYTGRSPLEAAAMGVELDAADVAFRCNLVTLSNDFKVMADFSAGHVTTNEAAELIRFVDERLGTDMLRFYPGVSYRHLMVWRDGITDMKCTPPHDISDRPILEHLPTGEGAETILGLMQASWDILADHPVNQSRVARGLKPANSLWLWGQGRRPVIESFERRFRKRGGMISAVDLLKGIAVNIGFENIAVKGATGWIDTNYRGKAAACIDGLKRHDLMCVHVESPDEAGHAGRVDYKIQAIEDFDQKIVGPVLDYLASHGDYRAVACPDHPTPVALKTHTRDPIPFAMCGTGIHADGNDAYDERLLTRGSRSFEPGHRMMEFMLNGQG